MLANLRVTVFIGVPAIPGGVYVEISDEVDNVIVTVSGPSLRYWVPRISSFSHIRLPGRADGLGRHASKAVIEVIKTSGLEKRWLDQLSESLANKPQKKCSPHNSTASAPRENDRCLYTGPVESHENSVKNLGG